MYRYDTSVSSEMRLIMDSSNLTKALKTMPKSLAVRT